MPRLRLVQQIRRDSHRSEVDILEFALQQLDIAARVAPDHLGKQVVMSGPQRATGTGCHGVDLLGGRAAHHVIDVDLWVRHSVVLRIWSRGRALAEELGARSRTCRSKALWVRSRQVVR